MKKKYLLYLFQTVFFLIYLNSSFPAQTVIDTLHQYPDTVNFFEYSNGPWTDDITDLAVKITLPDSLNYKINSILVLISSKIDTLHHPNLPIEISVGEFPEQNILGEKFIQTSIYYPYWQKIDLDSPISLQGYNSFYVSSTLIFALCTSYVSDSLYSNNYRYNDWHSIWQEGTYIYFPIKVIVEKNVSGIKGDKSTEKPQQFKLYQNYPNPFNPGTTIKYELNSSGYVTLDIYDSMGRKVSNLVNEYKKTGTYEIKYRPKNLSSGNYYCKLIFDKRLVAKKMIYIK